MIYYNTRPLWYFFLIQQLHGGTYTSFINLLCLGDSYGVLVLSLFDSCLVTNLQIIILQSYTVCLEKTLRII
jgi:hypothetical protein